MKTIVNVRPIQKSDFDYLDKYFGLLTIYKKPREQWIKYMEQTQTGVRMAVVAELDHEVVGYATLKFNSEYPNFRQADIPEINDIGVAPSQRKSGIGRELVEFLERTAKEKGYKEIGIGFGLYGDYGQAQRLYVKMGYVPDGQGVMYNYAPVVPGKSYPIDDDLVLFFTKSFL